MQSVSNILSSCERLWAGLDKAEHPSNGRPGPPYEP
jgi:hypothetical protein